MTNKVINLKRDDDELVIDSNNENLVEKALDYAVVEQASNMLAYSIKGIYSNEDKTKYKSPRALKKNPPELNVKDSNGNEVTFNLTKEFAKSLEKSLSEVNRAYYGYKYVSDKDLKKITIKERYNNFIKNIKKHPIKSFIGLLFILLLLFILIFGTRI